jgi:glycolate oxidase FAD binding subunit
VIPQAAADLLPRFEAILGRDAVETAGDRWAVDGVVPRVVVRPPDAPQLASVLHACAGAGAAVIPWGSGTAIAVGNPPRAADVVVATGRLARIVDYDHSNLTLTVEAGATLGAIDAALAAHGQFLPLEPPRAQAATIGGAAAIDLGGPRRIRYGAARGLVIGIRVARANGTMIRWGGKTVKNVAGYDMCKLFVGSLGTLGVIAELTVKVFPRPEVTRTIAAWGGSLAGLAELARRVLDSPLLPSAVTVLNRPAAGACGREVAGLLVRVEGVEAAVARHDRDITAWAARPGIEVERFSGETETAVWRAICDIGWGGDDAGGDPRDARAAIRVSVPAGQVAPLLERSAAMLPDGSGLVADAGGGTVWYTLSPGDLVAMTASAWRALAERHSGHLLLANVPRAVKDDGDVWAPAPPTRALDLMRGLKRAFDPQGMLNPGRYVARL